MPAAIQLLSQALDASIADTSQEISELGAKPLRAYEPRDGRNRSLARNAYEHFYLGIQEESCRVILQESTQFQPLKEPNLHPIEGGETDCACARDSEQEHPLMAGMRMPPSASSVVTPRPNTELPTR